MNKVPNRQVICDTLIEHGKEDRNIIVVTSDSRGSASMVSFANTLPEQFVEVGIAEQDLVGISAGLAACGKKPFAASPASFLTMRSIEQIKVDVAYSKTNVKLIGISGGVSYGALGMSHHSLQDIASVRSIPGIAIILPADRFETKKMTEALLKYNGPVYVRIGRNPVEDVYEDENYEYQIGKSVTMREGKDLTIIATGETVKPLDEEAIVKAAEDTGRIITIEEHSIFGGLGAAVSEVVVQKKPVSVRILGIPDEAAIAGSSSEIFQYYGLTAANLCKVSKEMLSK
ncbi:transketolase family protein [Clostridium magnum]|uniref:1-deoxy-D-xylulose-5-phosphate synthase n=1 Tax=Clostridium magnum DSM 2767 TaxID=1121326 RepID=A0A161WVL3_9CLOT|nr:transketolase C-terminal domain-containing protein [Clostridium magnum]KZL90968.1 1-deoxy-D-xylulose-5-phosphate synthase [Clostridium magnum DSM 2767]SHI99826.1 transketolase [Clostridium magnum DSM 2767]